jgi:hypothetical protein
MKRSLLIAAACVLAATPLASTAAMPRAAVATSGDVVVLAHGNYNYTGDHGRAFSHAFDRTLRLARDRDDSWSRGLRRFRDTFD